MAAIQQEKWGREVKKWKFDPLNMYTGGQDTVQLVGCFALNTSDLDSIPAIPHGPH